jgi:hypothetical protein
MKIRRLKKMGKNRILVHGLGYLIIMIFVVLLIPPTTGIARNDDSLHYEFFKLYIYPAAVAFWWKWIA